MQRVVWSLLALPTVLWAIIASGTRLLGFAPPGTQLEDAVMLGAYMALFTYVAMGVVTVPLLLLCFWRNWLTIWHAATVGAITGFMPFAAPAVSQLFDERLHLHYRLEQVARATSNEFVAFGILGGVLFWIVAIWRNPALPGPRRHRAQQPPNPDPPSSE